MKTLRITSAILAVAFIALILYANLRHLSVTERLKHVQLVSFNLSGSLSDKSRVSLTEKISSSPGVTACSINPEGTIASVIYYPDEVDEATLNALLSTQCNTEKRELAAVGGCPVHQVNASVQQFVSMLDLRTR
jgi:hypothetical protein